MTQAPLASASERREARRAGRLAATASAGAAASVLLYVLSRSNYLLFHGIVELFGVVVCFAIFVVAWNTRRWVSNHFLLFLGIAYLFVASVGIFHTLAYRGMGVFPSFTANQPTQFWILARYLEAFALLLAPLFLTRRLRPVIAFAAFSLVTGFGLLSICRLGVFPDCFVEGQGLTTFKVMSEYVISAALLGALLFVYLRRAAFEPRVFRFLAAGILAGVAAEMAFTLYTDVYGIANTVGHLFKLTAFYLVYRAVVVTSLVSPIALLFRDLAQERDRAQKYLDVAGVILIALDRDGRVQLINRKGAEVLGRRADEITGRDWFHDFLPDSRRPLALELFGALMAGKTEGAERTEGPVLSGAGGERTIAWRNTVLHDASGEVVAMLSSGEDVTEQRAAERELAASRQRLQLLFDRAPDGYYLSDLQGRFVDANRAAELMVGCKKEELLGKSFLEAGLLQPQDVPVAFGLLSRSLQGLSTGPDELTLVRKDGSTVIVEVRTEPVDVEGSPLVLGIARDVTERRQMETQARDASQRLERAMSAGSLAWWQMTLPSGDVVFDDRKATMLGYRPSDFSNYVNFTALLHPEDHVRTMQAMRDHLEGRAERYEVEYRIRTATGQYRWFRDVGSVTQRDAAGSPATVTGVVVDISRLKETEERLRSSNTELRELAARIDVAREEERAAVAWELHDEIGQSLSAMKMYLYSCGRQLPAGVQETVRPNLALMGQLLDDVIARLRRLYTDLVPVMLEDLGLAATIEWQAEEFQRQSGIDVAVGHVEDLRLPDERTALSMFRVLQEALENAVRHPGATRVTVDFEPEDGQAVLRVTDNGRGLLEGETDTARGRELAGIRERVRSWGGQVTITASATEGAVLRATAPLARD